MNPYILEIRRAELERDAACRTVPTDDRPDSAPERAAVAGLAIALVVGSLAIGSFAAGVTLV